MSALLPDLIWLMGIAQGSVLIASSLVPRKLHWNDELAFCRNSTDRCIGSTAAMSFCRSLPSV